jgi:hypothetical protein
MSFLGRILSTAISAGSKIASGASHAVGKASGFVTRMGSAVGKASQAFNKAKSVGKQAKGILNAISPEAGKAVDDLYNQKVIGNMSLANIVEHGDKGLANATGLADKAKLLLANLTPQENNSSEDMLGVD